MTLALDTVDEFAQWTTATPVTKTFTPIGTARGVVVGIAQVSASDDQITGVTYGGVAMARIGTAFIVTGGRSYLYFLGASIPTGAQTVSIATTGANTTRWAGIASVTGAADTVMPTFNTLAVNPTTTPQIALSTTGPSLRMCIEYWFSGPPASLVELSGMAAPVAAAEHPFGSQSAKMGRQSSPSSGSYTIGYTSGNAASMMVAGAFEEVLTPVTATFASTQAAQTMASSGLEKMTGTLTGTQASQTMTASGTSAATGGNRMGGTGAIRKPPR